jgi:hypothetical protein
MHRVVVSFSLSGFVRARLRSAILLQPPPAITCVERHHFQGQAIEPGLAFPADPFARGHNLLRGKGRILD